MAAKRIPLRKCTGCGEMKPKKELIRVVKTPDVKNEAGEVISCGAVCLDLTGKKSGRGAYVCRDIKCLKSAVKSKRFEKSLSCRIPQEVYDEMENQLSEALKSNN